jgi:proteasome lid subunit RPN8/RPN11
MTITAPVTTQFGFHVEYEDETGRVVRDLRIGLDGFGRAIRHTRFEAFCRGLVCDYRSSFPGVRIEPLFPANGSDSPRTKGFRVTIPLDDGGEHGCDFDIGYFRASANHLRAELLRTGQLTSEQQLYYRLNAFLDEGEPSRPANKLALSLGPPTQTTSIVTGCRSDFGPAVVWDESGHADLPALIELGVLEEAVDEAKANPDCEIGGFLLGHVFRDAASGEVFVAVTGLATASGTTESSGTSVTFTPASFAQVRNMTKLRGAGESVIGWYHSHPFKLCAECPLPTPPECIAKVLFYSQDDMHLMETTFEQPYMIGLLVAVEPRIEGAVGHLPVKLYGWCQGEIQERGFDVVGTVRT